MIDFFLISLCFGSSILCLPSAVKKKEKHFTHTQLLQQTAALCPPPSFFPPSSTLKLVQTSSTPICYRHQLFLCGMLAEMEEWLSRIRLRGTCQVACAYVRCRQIEMFAQSRASFSLCVSTFLSSLHPGEVLRESEVVLHDLFTPVENQGMRTSVTLTGLCK